MMKPLAIVGIDPGATTAYAVLDLEGKILRLFSAKELPLSEIISKIIEICQPLVTATDKARTPSLVEEFSRKVGTELFLPEEDLKKEEKRKVVAESFPESKEHHNEHESDCLAAALFAYRRYLSRLGKIRGFLQENHLEKIESEFIRLAIKEENLPFRVIQSLLTKTNEENKILRQVVVENKITKKDFLSLYQKCSRLQEEKLQLEKHLNQLHQERKLLQKSNTSLTQRSRNFDQRVESLLKFKEERLKLQSTEIEKLQQSLASEKEMEKRLYSFISQAADLRFQLLKKLDSLSKKEFEEKAPLLQIREGDFLLVQHPNICSEQVLQELRSRNIVLVSPEKIGQSLQKSFASLTISPEEILAENDHFALLDKEVFNRISQKGLIEKMISEYQEKRRSPLEK